MAKRRRLTPMPMETKSVDPGLVTPSSPRPGPMGAAPVAQVAGDAAGSAALQEMSDYLASARAEGRLVISVPLSKIEMAHMERDRLLGDDPAQDEDMQALMASLRARGQQVPIDVVRLTGDPRERYGLVSGLRRMTALRLLYQETQDPTFAEVKARLVQPEGLPDAYRAMIEENEIRAGLSFYERARIAVKAVEVGAFEDIRAALRGLYGSVSRAKRSKIGSFVPLVEELDDVLRFPAALSEKRGLALAKTLKEDASFVGRAKAALLKADPKDAEAEQALLVAAVSDGSTPRTRALRQNHGTPDRGVTVAYKAGKITLSGPNVTEDLHVRLAAWLHDQGIK